MSQARPHLLRLIGLLAAPLAVVAGLDLLAGLFFTPLALIYALGHDVMRFVGFARAAPVIPIGAGAAWLAHRIARQHRIAAPALVITTALALGTAAAASLPDFNEILGGTWQATLVAVLCWWATTTALATGGTALARRAPTGIAATAMALGGLVVLELTFAVYMLLVHRAHCMPSLSAFGAYPAVITGIGREFLAAPAYRSLHHLPALLTTCTTFTLTLSITSAKPSHARPQPTSTAPPRHRPLHNQQRIPPLPDAKQASASAADSVPMERYRARAGGRHGTAGSRPSRTRPQSRAP